MSSYSQTPLSFLGMNKLELIENSTVHKCRAVVILAVTLPCLWIWIDWIRTVYPGEVWLVGLVAFWYVLIWAVACHSDRLRWVVDFETQSITHR